MLRSYLFGILFLSLFFSFSTMSTSCTSDRLDPIEAPEVCDTLVPTYITDMALLVERTCAYTDCHNSGFSSGDYSSYEDMLSHLEDGEIFKRVIQLRDMPPSYAEGPKELTDEELELFNCWLVNGYPEN